MASAPPCVVSSTVLYAPGHRGLLHRAQRAWNLTCVCLALAGRGNVIQEVLEVDFFPNRASRGLGFFSLCEPQIVSIPHELEW